MRQHSKMPSVGPGTQNKAVVVMGMESVIRPLTSVKGKTGQEQLELCDCKVLGQTKYTVSQSSKMDENVSTLS